MLCEKSKELVAAFKDYKTDGWTLMEIVRFILMCISALVIFAENFIEMTGEEKAAWIAEEIKRIYESFDYDIPLIPEFIEKKIESAILDAILPGVIKYFYMKIFKKDDKLTIIE